MADDGEVRTALHDWVLSKADAGDFALTDATPLFGDTGVLTSLHVPELILLLERLRRELIDVEALQQGDFRDIDTIMTRFFAGEHRW